MAIPLITKLPPAPQRTDPPNFPAKGDALMGALDPMVTQINVAIDGFNAVQTEVTKAQNSATLAIEASNVVQATVNAIAWESGKTYPKDSVAISAVTFKSYRRKVAGAGTVDPSTDSNWALLGGTIINRAGRSSGTALTAVDASSFIDLTGTFTQSFNSPAALGSGWYCYLRNSGSGDITIPLSDGVANWVMYPGETRMFISDGSNLYSVCLTPFKKEFIVSGTFIQPPGYREYFVEVWGAGGGGAGAGYANACPGGGGGYMSKTFSRQDLNASSSITIGAGGAGGAGDYGAYGGTAGAGGTTSFVATASTLYATGGAGGSSGVNSASGGFGQGLNFAPYAGGVSQGGTTPASASTAFSGGAGGGSLNDGNGFSATGANGGSNYGAAPALGGYSAGANGGMFGGGAGGGRINNTTNGLAGGKGGIAGGGGAGGPSPNSSGAYKGGPGGAGGNGYCTIKGIQ